MKKAALFVHNLTVEYSLSIAQGVAAYFTQDKDVQLIIAQTNQPNYPYGLYEYQYWTSAELLKSDEIDIYIIVTSSYQTFTTENELLGLIKPFTKKPIVSIAVDLPFEKVHYTYTNCEKVYDQIIDHLKNVHGCSKIAFASANKTNSKEAKDRFEAFKNALQKHGLEYNPQLTVEGFFIKEAAFNTFSEFLRSKNSIDFDALVSANDSMAEGCIEALIKYGVKVPKDVKVIGFDDTSRASFFSPTLSTINQNINEQGFTAAEIAHKILLGQEQPRATRTEIEPIYRQSCGCIKMNNTTFTSRRQDGKITQNSKINSATLEKYTDYFSDEVRLYTLIDTFHATHTLKELFGILPEITLQLNFSSMAVILYERPLEFNKNEKIKIPDKAYLKTYIENNKQIIPYDEKGIEINPSKKLLPSTYISQISGTFILHPIFAGIKQYGYLIIQVPNNKFEIHHIYLKLIINAIANSYDLNMTLTKNEALTNRNERLLKNNQVLNIRSTMDELTHVLNRRGFMNRAEKELKRAARRKKSGYVFFADMDGLKQINDNYGHKIGDLAIQTEARILAESFRNTDIVGRLSGDEFAILSIGLTQSTISTIRSRLDKLNEQYSKEAGLPRILSISIGYVPFSPENSNLDELLSRADEKLYEEKEVKHAAQSNLDLH